MSGLARSKPSFISFSAMAPDAIEIATRTAKRLRPSTKRYATAITVMSVIIVGLPRLVTSQSQRKPRGTDRLGNMSRYPKGEKDCAVEGTAFLLYDILDNLRQQEKSRDATQAYQGLWFCLDSLKPTTWFESQCRFSVLRNSLPYQSSGCLLRTENVASELPPVLHDSIPGLARRIGAKAGSIKPRRDLRSHLSVFVSSHSRSAT
jgi:hypothetical protein